MSTIKNDINNDDEQKLLKEESNQKLVNEYLLLKVQCLSKSMKDCINVSSEFKTMKDFCDKQVLHLESKIDQFMHFQETQVKTFKVDILTKMESQETKIRESVLFEISGELQKRQIEDEQRRNKMNEILVQLNNNQIGEDLIRKTCEKAQISLNEISSIFQSQSTFDVIVQAWNNNSVVLDQNFDRKSILSIQSDEITSIIQMRNLIVCHCGIQDRTLFAFDINDSYQKKFQARTIERSFGAVCKFNDYEDTHFILGMKYGWISVYEVSNVGGLNEKGSKQVFPGHDVLSITPMNQEGIYAVGCLDFGVTLIKIELKTKPIQSKFINGNDGTGCEIQRLQYHFLRDKSITSIIETRPNIILCMSQKDCKYYQIDFFRFLETPIAQGFCKRSISMVKFPQYHQDKFPFVLAKEEEFITILDSQNGNIYKLVNVLGPRGADCNQQRLQFLQGSLSVASQFSFITDDSGVNLVKYEIDLDLIEVLKKIHA
eukprot:403376169